MQGMTRPVTTVSDSYRSSINIVVDRRLSIIFTFPFPFPFTSTTFTFRIRICILRSVILLTKIFDKSRPKEFRAPIRKTSSGRGGTTLDWVKGSMSRRMKAWYW